MKLAPLRTLDVRLDRSLETRVGGPEDAPKSPDSEATWLHSLASGPDREASRTRATSGARPLPKSSPLFAAQALPPKAKTAKAAFSDLREALCALKPGADAAEVRRALAGVGFRSVGERRGVAQFARGKTRAELRPFSIGGLPALQLEVTGKNKSGTKTKEGVYFQGTVFSPRHWSALQARYQAEVGRFVRAVRADEGPLPDDFDELKAFLQRGMSGAELQKREAREAELEQRLGAVSAQLQGMKAAGRAPKGVVVYVAGPDAAGKTSTGGIVMRALEEAGYAPGNAVFKAPSAEERAQHWLKRFERGIPEPGQAVFWDRGPAGDSVYGPADDAQAQKMGKEMSAFEAELRAQGILLIKVELFADTDKQAATFGKRLARQHIAAKLESGLAAQGHLDPDAVAGLSAIQGKLDGADFEAFERFDEVQGRFLRFVEASSQVEPWMVIDATRRHDARLKLIEGLSGALERFENR